jgi:hypothetical protein
MIFTENYPIIISAKIVWLRFITAKNTLKFFELTAYNNERKSDDCGL